MSKAVRYGSSRFVPWRLRPFVYPAAVLAAIAALFQPIPAMAAPTDPAPATPVSIPDSGSRPTQLGSLVLPGAPASTTTTVPATSITGIATSPIVAKVEKGRAEIATLGDELIRVGQDRDIVQNQVTTADQKVLAAQESLRSAQTAAVEAADAAVLDAAALPPGATGSGLIDLESLARLQRGDDTVHQAAARRLDSAQTAAQLALDEQTVSGAKYEQLNGEWTKLSAQLTKKQAAQQKLELDNAAELSAAETVQNAADQALGNDYLAGTEAGRSADARAIKALEFALAQRGDPYVWSEEGPDQYDCSGLMYAAYRSSGAGYPLVRVSRDQFNQTRNRTVSRYSLLPGDLLFFSSSNSWTGIHHVAMYAGEGMMVEAPRTGLNVRLTPVRWSRLFAATRVFGSIEGDTEAPDLGAPDPDEPAGTTPTSPAGTTPTSPSASPTKSAVPSTTPSKTPSPSTTPTKTTSPSTSPTKTTSPSTPVTTTTPPPATSPSAPATTTTPPPATSPSAPATTPAPAETSSSPAAVESSSSAAESSAAESSAASADTESNSPSESTSSSAE
ncbi:C40 family peptidase [Actinoplanes sp. CA-015351]|uniref:C40 family peptidase n=1 Tax=Actinoplanes sp. CA-015351 TaxID=3239897 RepID=UPI003D99390E